MPLSRTLIIGLVLAIGAVALFAWIGEEVREGDTLGFDEHVRAVVHTQATPALTSAMEFASLIGEPVSMTLLSLIAFLLFWRAGQVHAGILLAIALAGAALLDAVLKLGFRRVRPPPYFHYPEPHSSSFPSGHALISFCFFGMLMSLVTPRIHSVPLRVLLWLAAAILIALIGFSRIYLGVHYPTDVIAGYVAGFVWVSAVTFADRQRARREGK